MNFSYLTLHASRFTPYAYPLHFSLTYVCTHKGGAMPK